MKELTRTSRTAGYLEKLFRAINRDFFPGEEIQEPIITIQSTPRAYGHVSVAKTWKRKGEDERHELNVGAEWLERPIESLIGTLIHEMVHLYNMEHGVQDTSRGGTYHNKKFKAEAEKRGLIISHDDTIGWSITEPGDRVIEWVIANGWTEIEMSRRTSPYIGGWTPKGLGGGSGQQGAGTTKPKAPSSTRKYQCPKCKNSFRATKDINVLCMDCGVQFLKV